MLGFFKRFRQDKQERSPDPDVNKNFQARYAWFLELLSSNTEVLNIITDIEEKLQRGTIFGMAYIRSGSTRAVFHTLRMIKCLNALSNENFSQLYQNLKEIKLQIEEEIEKKHLSNHRTDKLILPYTEIDKEMVDFVGGKNANLGEISKNVKLPVPEGFAITTQAFDLFMKQNNLLDEINKCELEIKHNDLKNINQISGRIQRMITSAIVPAELETAILEINRQIQQNSGLGDNLRLAMRSSAVGEDSAVVKADSQSHDRNNEMAGSLSYAGQYSTKLNVTHENLVQTYKQILASLYSPHAILYRLNKGIREEDVVMSVACLQMVDAEISGVIYTRHPFDVLNDNIIISASWGLGSYIVSGMITPDVFTVAKVNSFKVIDQQLSSKTICLENNPEGGVIEKAVAKEKQDQPCLNSGQIKYLADCADILEKHFGCPQDIEWSIDKHGKIYILQSRPLSIAFSSKPTGINSSRLTQYPLLVENGSVAFAGVGWGKAYHVNSDKDLQSFPEGAVLVAEHSSPRFMSVMPKAEAIITNAGSITGHMASLAREFSVPTVLNLAHATEIITPGMEITVDAFSGRVYQGKAIELLTAKLPKESHLKDTPVFKTLKKIADYIIPLHLLDVKANNFTPQGCRTLHDIARFVHEMSYKVMFKLSDQISSQAGNALKLDVSIPIDLYLIDLGGGLLGLEKNTCKVNLHDVVSLPLLSLIKGMLHEGVQPIKARPIQFKGFFSVITNQMLSAPPTAERFGNRSYAIISDKYLNFSSRVGYHYSILDCYCGLTTNKNYITFSFKGGAADDVRRYRRASAIATMLTEMGFSVIVNGDRVDGHYRKYEASMITEKLELLGRLLQFTRQMDMLMNSEASVAAVAAAFREENYDFSPEN